MTGMLTQTRCSVATIPHSFMPKDLEPAFSVKTNEIARQIDALRIGASPSSIAVASFADKELSERVFETLATAKILTSKVAMHLQRSWRDRLFQQLDSLHDTSEWEKGDEPVHPSSYATFLKAILRLRPKRRPGLGLSHGGNLIAAWTTGRDRLTIEFLPNDRVAWVLACYEDDEPDRFAGQTGVTRLAEGLAPYRPERWFSDEGR